MSANYTSESQSKSKGHSVFLGMPSYGTVHIGAARAFHNASDLKRHKVNGKAQSSSLLAYSFNVLWASALNGWTKGELTHFAMLHSDIEAESLWLDKLLDEMDRVQADVLSVVVPIKTIEGLTSTALGRKDGNPWVIEKRLTIKELMAFPETFSAADVGYPGQPLLINTGCWVCKLGPWSEKVCFTINDGMMRHKDGTYEPVVESEDWGFSRAIHAMGLKVMATRKIRVHHHGDFSYPSGPGTHPWGSVVQDVAPIRMLDAERVA